MEQELDLRELFEVVKKRILWLLVIPVVAILISALVSFFVLTPVYEASTTLLVGRAQDQNPLAMQDIQLNRQLVHTYSEIAKSRTVANSVIEALRLDMSASQLRNLITISGVNNTEIIAVRVQNTDPELAQRIANQVTVSFSETVVGYSNIDNVMVVDEAILPSSPVAPRKMLNIAIAGVLGVMLAFGLIFLLEFMDNTVKTPSDVENLLGLTVMAAVPADGNLKGGKR